MLSRYVACVAARVYSHKTVEELAAYCTVPVINALSDLAHPCQALADAMTIEESFPSVRDVTIAYIGDANNVARSLAVVAAKLGIAYRIACPPGHQFAQEFLQEAQRLAAQSATSFMMTESPAEAAAGADVLYTDTWISMGQEAEAEERKQVFQGYCINGEMLRRASDRAIVMHCLPAHRGCEITDEVLEGRQSAVFDQAENRLHAQRAVLQLLMGV